MYTRRTSPQSATRREYSYICLALHQRISDLNESLSSLHYANLQSHRGSGRSGYSSPGCEWKCEFILQPWYIQRSIDLMGKRLRAGRYYASQTDPDLSWFISASSQSKWLFAQLGQVYVVLSLRHVTRPTNFTLTFP